MVLTIGCRGTPSLWILGSPYSLGGLEPSETSVDNHFTRQYNPEDSSEHHVVVVVEVRYIFFLVFFFFLFLFFFSYLIITTVPLE
jgi:hypothetical protein